MAALDAWKANEPPAKLKSLAGPGGVHGGTAVDPRPDRLHGREGRCDRQGRHPLHGHALKLKDRKGKVDDREVVYAVALKSPVVVARDPYY